MAEVLADQGALSTSHRGPVDALVNTLLQVQGGLENSVSAPELKRFTRGCLGHARNSKVEAKLLRVGRGTNDRDVERMTTYAVGTATAGDQRFRVLRPHIREIANRRRFWFISYPQPCHRTSAAE